MSDIIRADPHIASWSSRRQGRSPSIAPSTSSTRMTPETETQTSYSRGRIVGRRKKDDFRYSKRRQKGLLHQNCMYIPYTCEGKLFWCSPRSFLSVFSGHVAIKKTCVMFSFICLLTCPVCSVSSLFMRYIRKNLKDRRETWDKKIHYLQLVSWGQEGSNNLFKPKY